MREHPTLNNFSFLATTRPIERTLDAGDGIVVWTPSQISTVFWYDASDLSTITSSGNEVTQMLDKSGNGWTLAPTAPGKIGPNTGTRTLNGLNALEWVKTTTSTPSTQILENNSFTQDQRFFIAIVVRFDSDALADQDFLFSGTETQDPRIAVRRTSIDSFQILTQAGGAVTTPTGTVTEGNDYLALFKFDSTSSTIRLNGSLAAFGSIANNSFTSLNIGGNFNEDQSIDGLIAEIIAFTDINSQVIVEGYLAWKWGLQSNLPIGHLYKDSPPVL